jgi:hypothetical protein
LFPWYKWSLLKIELAPNPVSPAFAPVDDKILGQPLFSFSPDLVEEPLVYDIFQICVNAVKHHLDIVLPPSFALILRDVSPLEAMFGQKLCCLKVNSDDGNVESIVPIFVHCV